MVIFTPNTVIKSADVNLNFDDLDDRLAVFETDYVSTTLSGNFSTTASATFQNTGLSVTLSSAGTWIVFVEARVVGVAVANTWAVLRLYNSTTSTEITDSRRITEFTNAATQLQVTVPLTMPVVTTTANNVIRLEIQPSHANVHTLYAEGTSNGTTRMFAIRIK